MSSEKIFKFQLTHSSGFEYSYEGTLESLQAHLLANRGNKVLEENEV